jgi:S-formylglutathione hydrolase FrmB
VQRRRFITGVAAGAVAFVAADAALIEARVLPGRTALHRGLGGCGSGLTPAPTGRATTRIDDTFASAARRQQVGFTVLLPPGVERGEPVPVCLALHGRGGDHRWPVDALHLDGFLAAAPAAAPQRFAVVTVDGGDAVNWHRRSAPRPGRAGVEPADDPQDMITGELLPRLAGLGLDTDRLGLLGWSLGGAGALLLAHRMGAPRVRAVVAASPAIWTDAGATAEGTYDNPGDFDANRVDRLGPDLAGIPLHVDCGDLDPFADAVAAFRATVSPAPAGGIGPGCHDELYWTRRLPDHLAFLADHLGP